VQELLTKHTALVASYLNEKETYKPFMKRYVKLFQADNWLCVRQSLKLLGDVLMLRPNFKAMMRFIGSSNNLRLIITQLTEGASKTVMVEAFHVFKLFVGNPRKKSGIIKELVTRKDELIGFLERFRTKKRGKPDDPQFLEEKNQVIEALRTLQPAS